MNSVRLNGTIGVPLRAAAFLRTARYAAICLVILGIASAANASGLAEEHLQLAKSTFEALGDKQRGTYLSTAECRASSRKAARSDGPPRGVQTPDGRVAFTASVTEAGAIAVQKQVSAVVLLADEALPPNAASFSSPVLTLGPGRDVSLSALVTMQDTTARLHELKWPGWNMALLVRHERGNYPVVLGAILRRQSFGPVETIFAWFPFPASQQNGLETNLDGLERLYVHAFGTDANGHFRLVIAAGGLADTLTGEVSTHSSLLARLALARQCVASRIVRTTALRPVPWEFVSIKAEPASSGDGPLDVAAAIRGAYGKRMDVELIFSRLPHLSCSARTGASGAGRCKLEDALGHPPHPGFDFAPTIVTFPGEVTPNLVRVPRSAVFRRTPG